MFTASLSAVDKRIYPSDGTENESLVSLTTYFHGACESSTSSLAYARLQMHLDVRTHTYVHTYIQIHAHMHACAIVLHHRCLCACSFFGHLYHHMP